MRKSAILLAVALAALLQACSISQSSRVPNSHFVYPNSNVTPTRKGQGSRTKLCGILFFGWNGFTQDAQEGAYDDAIEEAGGDLLINSFMTTSMFLVPNLFTLCTTSVAGTGARMVVGKQELR
jgi:hypothetical protein